MRFKAVHGAVALALAASAVRGDSMCVVKNENSGMLFEDPCDNAPLHQRDGGGIGGKSEVGYEISTVVVAATVTAGSSLPITGEEEFSTLNGAYTTISEVDVTATLPVQPLTTARSTRTLTDGSKETFLAIQPAEQTAPAGEKLALLYGCNVAPNDLIICPFAGPNPPPEMFPAPTVAAFNIQRDVAPSAHEASVASVLASMVAATNLWPTGVHPFVAPTTTSSPASDCVESLAEEFALNVIYDVPLPAGFVNNKAVSNLGINLINGTLLDTRSRLGSIVANRQLQFDSFGQAGSIYTAGFQACGPPEKRLLALGGSTVWWGCVSGAFMNLYDQNIAPQCVSLRLSLLNNKEPGGDLDAASVATSEAASEPVSISTTRTYEDLEPTFIDKRATLSKPTDTWLHTMLIDSTPISVWAPYPVFTTDGVVWSATKTKCHGTHATYIGAPIATAMSKRNDVYDGVANDAPVYLQDISTVVTVTFAAETITMAASPVDDDTLETITVQPSTVTHAIPAAQFSPVGDAKEKRDETVVATVNGTTATTESLLFNPVATTSITASVTSVISQAMTSVIVTQTLTITMESVNATTSAAADAVIETTLTEVQNATATTTHTNDSTQFVTVSQTSTSNETTSFVTAGTATANSTTQLVILSTVTGSPAALNSTTQSSYVSWNISTFTATGLTLTPAYSTLLSNSASFDPPTTTDAVLSGTIGGGEAPASTTVAISAAAEGKAKSSSGYMPVCTALFVGLTVVFFAERYLGRLHV